MITFIRKYTQGCMKINPLLEKYTDLCAVKKNIQKKDN